MKITSFKQTISLCVFTLILGSRNEANAIEKTLNTKDTSIINALAKDALESFRSKLVTIADPDQDQTSRQYIIKGMVEPPDNIFTSGNASIENDLDPTVAKGAESKIIEYLNGFSAQFKPTPGGATDPVEFTLSEISNVKSNATGEIMYVKIYYSEMLHGTATALGGAVHKDKKLRVVQFNITKPDNKWKTLISGIYFQSGDIDKGKDVKITGAAADDNDVAVGKSDEYYNYLLTKGSKLLGDNNFVDAYLAFKEATSAKITKEKASAKINNELKPKMRNAGADINDELYKGLKNKAQVYVNAHKYEDAKRCFDYAFELNSTDKEIPPMIDDMNNKISILNKLEGFYKNAQYDQAISGYTSAIKSDSLNPYLWVGRGKNYAKIPGRENDARKDLRKAIVLDNTNLEAYKWTGLYNEQKINPAYDVAYNAFASYISNAPDITDPSLGVNDIYCEMSFIKGLMCKQKRSYLEAIDSFSNAIKLKPNFAKAILYQGVCQMELKNNEKALVKIKEALKADDKLAEAYYYKGRVEEMEDSKNGGEKFIDNLKTALKFDPNNSNYNFEMGSRLQSQGEYNEALKYLSTCIDAKGPEAVAATWKRGECYYKLSSFEAALEDYKAFNNNISNPTPKFFVDLGNVYIMKGDAVKAKENFAKGNNTPEAILGTGEAYYLENSTDKSKYMEFFDNAFKHGLNQETLNSDPFIIKNFSSDADFKKLRKKYKL